MGALINITPSRMGHILHPSMRSPRRILDCGCGPGDWAIEVATQYPDAEVLGIDVSPHMIPENPPDNMELQVDDLNGRFTFRSNHFDVVHSQMVAGGIHANRWRSYIRDIFRVLKPGGWCQMVELYFNAQSDNAVPRRPCPVAMVQTILGKPAALQRSAGTTSVSQLDEKRRVHGSRVETLDVANVRLVEW
ncbi:methyltransferase [Fusarium phyllophilum]|uniref:Methyltransferase n=1 Tax=Fusarium phyllophilum TaxID=47803 RepID=A0A8H5KE50_9HYPO|nr:methyltransferase [Fusarium phyllophilum]